MHSSERTTHRLAVRNRQLGKAASAWRSNANERLANNIDTTYIYDVFLVMACPILYDAVLHVQ